MEWICRRVMTAGYLLVSAVWVLASIGLIFLRKDLFGRRNHPRESGAADKDDFDVQQTIPPA